MEEKELAAMRQGVKELTEQVGYCESAQLNFVTHRTASARAALRYVEYLQSVGAGKVLSSPAERQEAEAEPSVEQEWAKVDPATAFHLIERHAEDWSDAGRMMLAWRDANPNPAAEQERQSMQLTLDAVAAALGDRFDPEAGHAISVLRLVRLAAPSSPSVSGTVDTATFREYVRKCSVTWDTYEWDGHLNDLIAHIDQHTAQAVRAAREEAIEQSAKLLEARGTKFNDAEFLEVGGEIRALATPQAAGTEQEPK